MPRCNQCGNETLFKHYVSGTETRSYTGNGDFLEVINDDVETDRVECAECGSVNLEF